ncbi:MAG: hypothetical protein K6L76_04620 [Agarilytica sp.]
MWKLVLVIGAFLAITACSKGDEPKSSEQAAAPQPEAKVAVEEAGAAEKPIIEPPVSMEAIEKAGFEKLQQKGLFQISGAIDAWAGKWNEELITEIYLYESAELVNAKFFAESVAEGNSAGWVEFCEHKNVFLVSQSETACDKLRKL